MCIKLPRYLFFHIALGLNDFDAGKSITKAIGRGMGTENLDFFGPQKVEIFSWAKLYRIQNTDTHVHKITNVTVFLYDFDARKSITWAIERDGP
jgi:hypothetical protein